LADAAAFVPLLEMEGPT